MNVCLCVLELTATHFNFSVIFMATCKRSNSPTTCALASSSLYMFLIHFLFLHVYLHCLHKLWMGGCLPTYSYFLSSQHCKRFYTIIICLVNGVPPLCRLKLSQAVIPQNLWHASWSQKLSISFFLAQPACGSQPAASDAQASNKKR